MKRTNLKVFRIKHFMTQAEIAELVGCNRITYASVENGKRNGRPIFWNAFKSAFNLTDEELSELMKCEED